ncbi:hypothetical protein [Metabacillus endolithicus]|uniref:SMODS-associating 2TM beta-strand rich effector domain-containing protein n=1 Tax=Metabacillus endolithicus TaxID=1535204 RepID=A0ABW5BYG0_9BACI|nr:hypothetical protein [Metabacillus endolithicus]UPG65523.1 hypothetical protein MVE64_11440 [Metabacillus endolithicus]
MRSVRYFISALLIAVGLCMLLIDMVFPTTDGTLFNVWSRCLFFGLLLSIGIDKIGEYLRVKEFKEKLNEDPIITTRVSLQGIDGLKGTMGLTEDSLVFISNKDSYKFNFNNIIGYHYGSEGTGYYVSNEMGTFQYLKEQLSIMVESEGQKSEYKFYFKDRFEGRNKKIVKLLKQKCNFDNHINKFKVI